MEKQFPGDLASQGNEWAKGRRVGGIGGRDGRHGDRDYNGGNRSPNRQHGGLNPQRQKGFVLTRRIEAPTLNDMRTGRGLWWGNL